MAVRGKVLIVEDDRAICSFMRRVLEANGYESIIVGTGREALSMLTSHCPDVVILDRVSPIPHRHVLGEHLQLGAHLQNRAMVAHHRFLIERLLGKNVLAVGWNDIRINGRRAP